MSFSVLALGALVDDPVERTSGVREAIRYRQTTRAD
jgi:hypothetical protein